MDILALNSSFEPIKYLNYINLQWVRRYHTAGQFDIQIPASEYDNNIAYIYTNERPELGIVHFCSLSSRPTGDYVELKGYFYEYKLIDKIMYPRYRKSGTPEVIARHAVTTFKADIPVVLGTALGIGSRTSLQATGAELGKQLYDLLKTQEQSYRVRYLINNNNLVFDVWQGKDRTQNQAVNSWVTFSDGFRNMGNTEAVIDTSNYKNYAVVVGNGDYEDGNQITVVVDKSNAGYKQQLYVDATSMMYDSEDQTLEDYKSSLTQKGEEELLKRSVVNSVNFDPDVSRLKYMTDYDLGDKCDVILDKLGRSFTTRITEVYEVFKNGTHTIKLTFGEVSPTVYQKARLK